jgi:hypothetical protein
MTRPTTIHEVEDDDVIRFGSRAVKRGKARAAIEAAVDKTESSSDGTVIKTPAEEEEERVVTDDSDTVLKLLVRAYRTS